MLLRIGSDNLTVNGREIRMDAPPVISNSRIYLPARYVAEAFGYQVSWHAARAR